MIAILIGRLNFLIVDNSEQVILNDPSPSIKRTVLSGHATWLKMKRQGDPPMKRMINNYIDQYYDNQSINT